MRTFLVAFSFAITLSVSAQENRGVGYATVAAAMEALRARGDVKISVQDGWTIIEDRSAQAFWSFTPQGHPSHPAAVKREIVSRDGSLFIDMSALCEASKAACDKLMVEFKELNERMSQSIRAQGESSKAAPSSEIQVESLGNDSFRLVLRSFRSRTVDAGQEELLPKAREVCAGKEVGYERYEFETIDGVSAGAEMRPLVLKQDIRCGVPSPRPPTVSTGNRDSSWRPTPAQSQLVERQTYAFFAAKDGRKYQEAYALLSAAQKQTIPYERWSSLADDFNSKVGEVRRRTIKKVTWYKDPPNSQPGVYAAADFSSEFDRAAAHCGYVVWSEQPDGSFLLVREEQNFLDKASEAKLKPVDRERFRSQFGC
ncbi:MAG: DUF4019 domain-containing protein [Betaproteobacteria bacterium]|nr:DUF4019 domain-containing protein [Betaproteobacteria bacterium]